ncbi:MAG: hypothetical protein EP297_09665 [Gammaproteobacteria bacterium]|nr:MAG: hypothetical protein EP297_09665 [Gammaproteobacteria bacterium]
MAERIITRLKQENLLYSSESDEYRVRAISLEACEGNQQSIQQQHDEGIQNALKNWLTESTGGKAGNKRLKNLKR